MIIGLINPELCSSVFHTCSNLKRACCVEWALPSLQIKSLSNLFMYTDQTLREETKC